MTLALPCTRKKLDRKAGGGADGIPKLSLKKVFQGKILLSTFPLLPFNEPIWLKECFKEFRML